MKGGHGIALQASRYKTRYPGVYFRLNAAGERRYQISYKDSNGKRVFKTVEGNEKDALAARNDVTLRMRKGERVVRSKMTVQELGEEYLRQTTHLKPGTLKDYGYAFDHWVVPRLGHLKISSVTVDEIADFISELRQVHTANTIRNCLKPLAGMFRLAVRRGWAAQNPVHALDRQEKPSGAVRRMRILSSDEIKQLLAVSAEGYRHRNKNGHLGQRIDGAYGLLFTTAIFTGLRRGELLALDWSDVDLDRSELHVRAGKTAAATRTVVLPGFLVQALAKASLCRANENSGKLFPFTERNVGRALDAALERAGIEHIRFHDLRHTFASILIGQGEDVTYVADQMGHASPSTTLKTYAKLFDPKNRRQAARDRMQETFKGVVR
jgi:integrase